MKIKPFILFSFIILILALGLIVRQQVKINSLEKQVLLEETIKSATISQEKAIEIVNSLPEVQEKTKELTNLGAKLVFFAFDNDNYWLVKFAEDKSTYVTAIEWYKVDKKTGNILK